ncbi:MULTISPECIES: ABC transporter substrate-binding protein [unclassified Chelatococcus]|uniref:ABC transporter substrate-binding protein n=1 Tax=unclassified Chelatococcus TaxID=2638111 RepID=UPI001BCDD257|nr:MULTISPECIES: ABC transporter substrate-binding protein [unclassified Chelatococcus]MBS7700247.1 ABC transporter substrate-binding protein [Chelatococcus sp. YT9]MBX3558218.1 ABC transporter substrate-binding protein [Chelatococcus sp.]
MVLDNTRQVRCLLTAAFMMCSVGLAQAADQIRVAAAAINIAHGPVALIAADPMIFADKGLTLKLTDLHGQSPNCIAALLSKAADLCQVGTTTGTDAIAEGADLVAIAAVSGPNAEVILSADSVAKLGVAANAPINDRIRALKGLRLVTSAPGSAIYTLTDAMLQTVGLSIADVKYRTLAEVPAMIESIRNNQIDGAVWVIGSLAPLLVEGKGVRWISLARGDVEKYSGLPFVTVFARRDWAEANPELVSRIQAAYAEAIRRLRDNPETSSRLIKDKFFPDMEQALWDDGYAQAREAFLNGAKTNAKAWAQFLDLQAISSQKDYGPAAFDRVVIGAARAE